MKTSRSFFDWFDWCLERVFLLCLALCVLLAAGRAMRPPPPEPTQVIFDWPPAQHPQSKQ